MRKGARNAGLQLSPQPRVGCEFYIHTSVVTTNRRSLGVPRAVFDGLLHRPRWTFLHRNAGS